MDSQKRVAILGGGNIGLAIAKGLEISNLYPPENIYITRRHIEQLDEFKSKGFKIAADNKLAVKNSEILIIAVQPKQLDELLKDISSEINKEKHLVISVVSGAGIKVIKKLIGNEVKVVRAMPNTAIAIQESMTCLSSEFKTDSSLMTAKKIFDSVGKTMIIEEDLMVPATALCACGIAFFLRAIRAASQGGIEIGFHSDEAIFMAAQTAKGAASLLVNTKSHPESEVDKVTTPRGITISGLNQMEHNGFSSAMIKGITTSADKAARLYNNE
ncbi:MAG: pyrroline-5-carboxylate reductase [Bacteroidetes bacterium]|nr:pyrroline-5-carboxylate reductase [Bacteroidota bacterium]